MKNNENGRSMIEMLGVLAIIGVLSVGGIAGYSKAMMKYRTNKTIEQISMIVTNVRTLFGSQKNYKALGTTTASSLIAKAKLFPDELLNGSTGIIENGNPFGGAIELVAAARASATAVETACTNCGDAKAFVVAFKNIPEEACMDLATQDWGSASGSGLIEANVVKTVADNTLSNFQKKISACTVGNGVACGGKGPMTAADAAAICDGDANALLLKFY